MIKWARKNLNKLKSSPDELLVKKAQKNNADAFGELYLKYLESIYRFVFFRVNQNQLLAEDLTEIVFFKAFKNIKKYTPQPDGNGSFRSWLYKITRSQIIDHYRRQRDSSTTNEKELVDEDQNLENQAIKQEQIQNVMQAINQLTPSQKDIIILRYIEEVSYTEISQILEKDYDSLRALNYRALQRLKEIMT